jgi:hypothetical protein
MAAKGHVGLIEFNEAGEMIEFTVMIRPIRVLPALGDEMGTGSGPQLMRLEGGAAPRLS